MSSATVDMIDSIEWKAICDDLRNYHAVFYKIVEIGKPSFRSDIKTACVSFDKVGKFVNFFFNPEFWNKLNHYNKLFVICHEACHILLNHGLRFNDPNNAAIANVAMDIAVNHGLVNRFGFVREDVLDHETLCWVDTVFPGEKRPDGWPIPDDDSSEYYFRLLLKKNKNKSQQNGSGQPQKGSKGGKSKKDKSDNDGESGDQKGEGNPSENQDNKGQGNGSPYRTLDDHDFSFPTESDIDGQNQKPSSETSDFSDVIKKLDKELSDEEKKELEGFIKTQAPNTMAGTGSGDLWHIIPDEVLNARKNRKWEEVIKDWTKKALKKVYKPFSQWSRQNRRHVMLPKTFMLPSKMNIEGMAMEKDKIDIRFYFDVSASCYSYKDRFINAAYSIDPKKFNISAYSFDTDITPIDLNTVKQIRVGGGTAFDIIESDIQNDIKFKNMKYPEAVWVLTDGHGTFVNPEKPERWFWFITPRGTKDLIPKTSKAFNLADFE